jgi:hypothetical protein
MTPTAARAIRHDPFLQDEEHLGSVLVRKLQLIGELPHFGNELVFVVVDGDELLASVLLDHLAGNAATWRDRRVAAQERPLKVLDATCPQECLKRLRIFLGERHDHDALHLA